MPNKFNAPIPGSEPENNGEPEQEKNKNRDVIHNGSGGAFEASEGRIEDVEDVQDVREEKETKEDSGTAY